MIFKRFDKFEQVSIFFLRCVIDYLKVLTSCNTVAPYMTAHGNQFIQSLRPASVRARVAAVVITSKVWEHMFKQCLNVCVFGGVPPG